MNELNIELTRARTIRDVAKTGIIPEHALRWLVKRGEIPSVQIGNTSYIVLLNVQNYLIDGTRNKPVEVE